MDSKTFLDTGKEFMNGFWDAVQTKKDCLPLGWRLSGTDRDRMEDRRVIPTSNAEVKVRNAHAGEKCVCGKKIKYACDVKLTLAVATACDLESDEITVGQECVSYLSGIGSFECEHMEKQLKRIKFLAKHGVTE